MSKKYISTLEFYGYGENNRMEPALGGAYKVKVSDKDGNIITIEKDGSLFAMVGLALNGGNLVLLDKAHNDSVLAEVEFPNAGEISNCKFDEDTNSIEFDILTLNGETQSISIDVQSLVDVYEAGQGIEIGEKNEETGKKPISIKLVEGEELLQLSDEGLGLDEDKVVTADELEEAISGKADTEYVDELFADLSGVTSGITEILEIIDEYGDEIEKIKEILGTDETDPSIQEKLDDKADRDELADIDEEIGNLSGIVDTISGDVETIKEDVSGLTEAVDELEDVVEGINDGLTELSGKVETEITERKEGAFASAEYDSVEKVINFKNANDEVISTIDARDFIKDGMVDDVKIENGNLVIVFNTDAGKETIEIPLTEIFNPDNYYTKDEVDDLIAAERTSRRNADLDLWAALDTETNERRRADQTEATTREAADDELRAMIVPEDVIDEKIANAIDGIEDAIAEEKERAEAAEGALQDAIDALDGRITGFEDALEEEKTARENGDAALQSAINGLDGRITGFENALADETQARQDADDELAEAIGTIRDTYATIEYVNTKDAETLETAVNNAVASAKTYTDNEVDAMETELKIYCDSGHTELQRAISNNTTRINAVTEWDGQGVYDDSDKNGVLDVLHREFHELVVDIDPETINGKFNTISGAVDNNTAAIATKANADDVYTKEECDDKFLTEHQDISNLATKDEVNEGLALKADADTVYTQSEVDALLLAKENEIYNLTKIVGDMGGAVTYEYPNEAGKSLTTLLGNNGTVKLTEDATITRFGPGVTAKNNVKLNLNNHNLTSTSAGSYGAIMGRGTQEITIYGKGTVDAGDGVCIEANGADCTINLTGSTTVYQNDRSGGELIYCYAGTINITNGTFKNNGADKTFMLNCYDANYRAGTAKIIVTGGKFYDFNPADNSAEGEHTSFVPEGYHVETSIDGDSTVYTVKRD